MWNMLRVTNGGTVHVRSHFPRFVPPPPKKRPTPPKPSCSPEIMKANLQRSTQVTTETEDDEFEEVQVEENENEQNRHRHRGQGSVEVEEDENERNRNRQSRRRWRNKPRKRGQKFDQGIHARMDVRELRFSQRSVKPTFRCGRSVNQLVQDLWDRKVSLSAPFLRLTVFETKDERTNQTIWRSIDNRRLFALKKYASKCRQQSMMVNVNIFSHGTVMQVQRFFQNSDVTDGKDVRLRKAKVKDEWAKSPRKAGAYGTWH